MNHWTQLTLARRVRAVAEAYPDATQGLIEGAREELRAQLDGTHRRQKSADIERWFNEQG